MTASRTNRPKFQHTDNTGAKPLDLASSRIRKIRPDQTRAELQKIKVDAQEVDPESSPNTGTMLVIIEMGFHLQDGRKRDLIRGTTPMLIKDQCSKVRLIGHIDVLIFAKDSHSGMGPFPDYPSIAFKHPPQLRVHASQDSSGFLGRAPYKCSGAKKGRLEGLCMV